MIRKSEDFKGYVNKVSAEIRENFKKKGKIENGKLILDDFERFHFKNKLENFYQTGLVISIDQVSYIEVELNHVAYQNGKPSKLKTTFIVYDTYGLDDEDIRKYGLLSGFGKEDWLTFLSRDWKQMGISTTLGWFFNCWWVLQYHHDCVPLLVKLRIENVEITL